MELEAMVESGQLKVIDEKKCLGEVSQLRKMRKQFDGFVPQEAAIDATKAKIATLRKQLDGFEPECMWGVAWHELELCRK